MPVLAENQSVQGAELPAILIKAREESAQRLMEAYALVGLFFMLLPGTFLGAWNLLSISGRRGAVVSPAWIQAHGHAQIFGWIGTFILGIGFYSIPKMTRGRARPDRGWLALLLWTAGAFLRWIAGVYQWHWHAMLPISALLELSAFLIFFRSVSAHRPAVSRDSGSAPPLWIVSVLIGTGGFGAGLLMNLAAAAYVTWKETTPAFPADFESRFLTLLLYAFILPTVWGFSARWLPTFLGLKSLNGSLLGLALILDVAGVVLAQAGFNRVAPWLLLAAAALVVGAFRLLEPGERPPKTARVHPSFSSFIRIAYIWLILATVLGICAAYLDHHNGWVGASRHALTVGFIATMVFSVGQRVLPAFAGMRVLYSSALMLICLVLLTVGCALRVSTEILAYERYWQPAWRALPWSAGCEVAAVAIFAVNLVLTFKQPPAHQMKVAGMA